MNHNSVVFALVLCIGVLVLGYLLCQVMKKQDECSDRGGVLIRGVCVKELK